MQVTSDLVQRRCVPENWPNNAKFYGAIVGGGSAKGWTVSIDLFPIDFKNVQKVKGPRLRILRKDEIEPAIDLANMEEDDWEDIGEKKSSSPWMKASSNFAKLDKEAARSSKSFEFPHDKDGGAMTWEIKDAGDDVNLATFEPEACNIEIDMKDSLSNNFFKHVFLSVEGHAKLMNAFLSNEKATCYCTVKNRKIIFFDADADDPDHAMKQCYLLVVAASTELEDETKNL